MTTAVEPLKMQKTACESTEMPLRTHIATPGHVSAGFSFGFIYCTGRDSLADCCLTRPVRCADGVIGLAEVRHEGLRRTFPGIKHFREAGIGLEDEASASYRQRAPEYLVLCLQSYRRGV